MMHQYFFYIAGKAAIMNDKKRKYYIGAIGIGLNGLITRASIIRNTTDSHNKHHAEYRLCEKFTSTSSVIYVARLSRLETSTFALARPCQKCLNTLCTRDVRKIYYTIDDTFYGVIKLKGGIIVSEKSKRITYHNSFHRLIKRSIK